MVEQGRTISFQLSTGGVDKLSNVSETEVGHLFRPAVEPGTIRPFLCTAQSRAVFAQFCEYIHQYRLDIQKSNARLLVVKMQRS